VKPGEVVKTILLTALAVAFVSSSVARLPTPSDRQPFRYAPVVVYSDLMLPPAIVNAIPPAPPRMIEKHRPGAGRRSTGRHRFWPTRGPFTRAKGGHKVEVSLTQYCLQGTTRLDHWVREGIVAADPRVFPLAHYVRIFLGEHYLGRFLVDDTGRNVKGPTLDIWNPNCREARRFGRQWGTATLVVNPER